MKRTTKHFAVAIISLMLSNKCADANEPVCTNGSDYSPIYENINVPSHDGFRAELLKIDFDLQSYPSKNDDTIKVDVVIPTISLQADIEDFISIRRSEMEREAREALERDHLTLGGFRFDSITVQGPTLNIRGFVTVEKHWKLAWTCCQWFQCRRCEKDIKVYSKTPEFWAHVNRKFTPIPTNFYADAVSSFSPRMKIVTARAEGRTGLDLYGQGEKYIRSKAFKAV